MRVIPFLFFSLLFSIGIYGQDAIIITSTNEVYEINSHSNVYQTPDILETDQVLNLIADNELESIDAKINPGMNDSSTHWVHFKISNKTDGELKYIEIGFPQLDYVTLYEIENDSSKLLYATGDMFLFKERPIQYRNFIFPITIPYDSEGEYLLHIEKKNSAVSFPLSVYDASLYPAKASKESIFFGLYFGILFLVALFSLVVGFFLKRKVFIIYGAYVTAFALWFFSREGFTYEFITSSYPILNMHFYPACTSLSTVLLIMYVQAFFQTRQLIPSFHKVMSFLVVFFLVGFVVWILFPTEYLEHAPQLFALRYIILILTIVFAYTSAIKSLKIYPLRGKAFLIGYSVFFFGILFELADEYGLVNGHSLIVPPIMLGYIVEVFALSIAMGSIILGILEHRDELVIHNNELKRSVSRLESQNADNQKTFITLKSKALIDPDKIRYIQSDDHYLEFYLIHKDNPEIDRNKISAIIELLPPQFTQIHRSTVVNLSHVKSVFSDKIQMRGGEELRLSRTYKKELEKRLNN